MFIPKSDVWERKCSQVHKCSYPKVCCARIALFVNVLTPKRLLAAQMFFPFCLLCARIALFSNVLSQKRFLGAQMCFSIFCDLIELFLTILKQMRLLRAQMFSPFLAFCARISLFVNVLTQDRFLGAQMFTSAWMFLPKSVLCSASSVRPAVPNAFSIIRILTRLSSGEGTYENMNFELKIIRFIIISCNINPYFSYIYCVQVLIK
jgi:hypothetical protein